MSTRYPRSLLRAPALREGWDTFHLFPTAVVSLPILQQRLVKTGGRLVRYARYYWLLLAEGHLTRRFGAMLGRIVLPPIPTG